MGYQQTSRPAVGHMPFANHRTLKEVREDEERHIELIKLRKQIHSA